MKKILPYPIVLLFSLLLLLPVVKGKPRFYQDATHRDARISSPFELTNTTSRYLLTEAIVKNHTLFFSTTEAKFSAPDVVDYKGRFFSIFAPGVSFIGIPFYYIGSLLKIPQLLTFFSMSLFALVDVFLIALLSQRLGATRFAGLLSGAIFLFATNVLSYSQTFTQHLISVALILTFILIVSPLKKSSLNYFFLGLIIAFAALVDIPNIILIFPALISLFIQSFQFIFNNFRVKVKINLASILIIIGLLPGIVTFAWYNFATTGSYTKLAQFIGRTHYFRDNLPIQDPAESTQSLDPTAVKSESSISLPFDTRLLLDGFYTLLISNERSWLYYSPVVLLGLLSFLTIRNPYTRANKLLILCMATVSLNILIYAMFGDPWGGWAFGPRYLIPAAAILTSGVGVFITRFGHRFFPATVFLILLVYSIYINSLGVLTTNAIPPRQEAIHFTPRLPYTYEYNEQLVNKNQSSSLLYNAIFSGELKLRHYLLIYSSVVSLFVISLYAIALKNRQHV
ncbi:hypothetical protein HYS82_03285 [Candidatus Amesbacteria bacterium]|nr:hypothetical protein [Candidatus Amesbacteria bacterium]